MGYFQNIYETDIRNTVVTTIDNGGKKWTDSVFAKTDDDNYAYCNVSGTFSQALNWRALQGSPLTSWPTNTVITGLEINISGYSDNVSNHEISSIFLSDNDVQVSNDLGPTGTYLPTVDDRTVLGTPTEMWGLTSSDIRDLLSKKTGGVQVVFNDTGGAGGNVYIDDVFLVVYYDKFKTHSLLGAGL